jgi:hypothetical protein
VLLSSNATLINITPIKYVQETSGTSNAMALKFTTLHKPT